EAAELLLDEARLRLEKLRDRGRAALVLDAAAERLRATPGEHAERLLAAAQRMRAELGGAAVHVPAATGNATPTATSSEPLSPALPPLGGGTEPEPPTPTPALSPDARDPTTLSFWSLSRPAPADAALEPPVAPAPEPLDPALDSDPSPTFDERLRAAAAGTTGAERAGYLDRLADRLARRGDLAAAADAALGALEVDPSAPARLVRAVSLCRDDRARLVAVRRLGVRGAATPGERAAAMRELGVVLASDAASLPEAAEVLERALALDPASGAAAAALGAALLALGHADRAVSVLAPFERGAPDLPAIEAAGLLARAADAAAPVTRAAVPERAEAAPAALERALARARETPFDAAALREVVRLADVTAAGDARRLAVLSRAAAGLAAFASGDRAPAPGEAIPIRVGPEARDGAAHPGARSCVARLLVLLAPWLEALFPADLARRGVSGRHRLGPQRAPELLALLEDAQRALGARPFAAFLADAGGCELALENTRPPSIVLGAAVARSLRLEERRFLLARALALADLGWALAGKFAPRDVAIVCELACRFAGGAPPSEALPAERARPFLDALERLVPPSVRGQAAVLAEGAAGELAALAPRELA
ncbi:MAG TPA: hypothetical protein VF904_18840, partial [Anaeromyxobacteraceae bacterium]